MSEGESVYSHGVPAGMPALFIDLVFCVREAATTPKFGAHEMAGRIANLSVATWIPSATEREPRGRCITPEAALPAFVAVLSANANQSFRTTDNIVRVGLNYKWGSY